MERFLFIQSLHVHEYKVESVDVKIIANLIDDINIILILSTLTLARNQKLNATIHVIP